MVRFGGFHKKVNLNGTDEGEDSETPAPRAVNKARVSDKMGMNAHGKDEDGNHVFSGAAHGGRVSTRGGKVEPRGSMVPIEITHDVNMGDFWSPKRTTKSKNNKSSSSSMEIEGGELIENIPIESSTKKRAVVFNLKRINSKLALLREKERAEEVKRKAEEERRKRKDFNFAIGEDEHVQLVRFEEYSLDLFSKSNRFRQFFVRMVVNVWFDRFVLTMIVMNAFIFAITDYTHVDENGDLMTAGSWRNSLNVNTNAMFVVIFTCELVIKVIAQGFYGNHGAYLCSSWNILDLVVVVTGLIVLFDSNLENISSLRMIRILRPLRSLSMLPSLRNIISSIFAAIPELSGVFTILGFLFLLFAIAGMELFGGPGLHSRCRATPYPVHLNYTPFIGLDYADYRCLSGSTYSLEEEDESLTKATSPWATRQDCYWPLAEPDSPRLCSLDGSGMNVCINNHASVDAGNWSWCGSNYDARGNRRFHNYRAGHVDITYGNGFYGMNDGDMYNADLNFGYSQFDSFGTAVLTIFQTITEEGWTKILYMLMDVFGASVSVPYFVLLILFGVFFVLQLLLAVLEDNFSRANDVVQSKVKQEEEEKAAKVRRLKNMKNRDRKQEIYHVALIEDSLVQTKLLNLQLLGIEKVLKKEVHVDTFRDVSKLLDTYSIPELLVQFDCVMIGQLNNPESVMYGSDFLVMIDRYRANNPKPRRLHKNEAIFPYKLDLKLAITANYDAYAQTLLEAGAHLVLDKVADCDIGLALRRSLLNGDGSIRKWTDDANRQPRAGEAEGDSEKIDSQTFISRKDAHALTYQTQMALNAAHKRGIRMVCFNSQLRHHMASHKQNFMTSLVTPPQPTHSDDDETGSDDSNTDDDDKALDASFVERIPCTVCREEIVGACYLCELCDTVICSLCALTEWDPTFVLPGETVQTPFGACIVKEVRRKPEHADTTTRTHPTKGILDIEDFISCIVCEPSTWLMAGGQAPKFYLNPKDVQVPTFKQGDIVDTVYGGHGTIASVKKGLSGTHYVVRLDGWKLATDKSPVLFLNRQAIRMVLEYDPEHPYYHVNLARYSETRRQTLKIWDNSTDDSTCGQLVGGCTSMHESIHHCLDVPCGSDGDSGFRRFAQKRVSDISVRYKTAAARLGLRKNKYTFSDLDESVDIDDDDDDEDNKAHILVTKDPKSFVRLPELMLEDMVGKTLAMYWLSFVASLLECFANTTVSVKAFVAKVAEKEEKAPQDMTTWDKFVEWYYAKCVAISEYEHFDAVSGGLIMTNCIILMSDHYPMSTVSNDFLDVSNAFLTIIFFFEMCVFLGAQGPSFYTRDYMNMFDAFVVMASLVDLCLEPPSILGSTGAGLGSLSSVSSVISMLRCFRLFRIVKLALKVKSLKILFARIIKTFFDLNSFALLLGLILFIYTVAGLQFFSNRFRFDEYGRVIQTIRSTEWENAYEVSTYCFDNFSLAFATVFQILTTENWNDIMFDTWRVYGPAGVLFPCSLVLMGTFVLMNLFLGILLGNFTSEDNGPDFEGFNTEPDKDDALKRTKRDSMVSMNSMSSFIMDKVAGATSSIRSGGDKQHDSSSFVSVKENDDFDLVELSEDISDRSEDMGPFRHSDMEGSAFIDNDGDDGHEVSDNSDASTQDHEHSAKKLGKSLSERHATIDGATRWEALGLQCYACLAFICGSVPSEEVDNFSEDEGVTVESVRVKNERSVDLLSVNVEALDDDLVFPLPNVYAIGVFHRTNPLRYRCAKILTHPRFEACIQTFIFLSSVALIFDNPLTNPDSDTAQFIEYFQYFTTVLFTLEMTVKVITFGFLFNERAYLRSSWNVLDFIIVMVSIIGLFNSTSLGSAGGAIKTIRVFRAFRPLRVINRAPGLRLIVNAVIESVPDVLNVVGVLIVTFSIFAVVSVNFLKGDLRHCSGDTYEANIAVDDAAMDFITYPVSWNLASTAQKTMLGPSSTVRDFATDLGCTETNCCATYMTDYTWDNAVAPTSEMLCRCLGGSWSPVTFTVLDNYPVALMALFIISTTEGWVDLMYAAVDARGVGMQPVGGYNVGYVYFFVLFILVGSFFALNLFVGVMMDNFGRAKRLCNGQVAYMTPEQQEWVKNYKIVKSIGPYLFKKAPKDGIGKFMFDICQLHVFEYTVLGIISLNTIALASSYFGFSDSHEFALEILNTIFSGIFTVEMIMKLIAYRASYFRSKWNVFDFFVTIGTDVGTIIFWVTGNSTATAIILIRFFRVLRVVRLVEGLSYAKRLIDTLIYTLPGIINITVLLLLLLFIYAVLGVQLFAKVNYNESYDEYANFRTFENAILTLFRFTTGEGWGIYMFDVYEQLDNCVSDPPYDDTMCGFNDDVGCTPLDGCGSVVIFPFLLSFTIVVSMVLFNLFVGIIIEGFQKANEDNAGLTSDDYKTFCKHWAKWDDNGDLFIAVEDLEELVATLPPPLGLKEIHPAHNEIVKYLQQLDMNVYQVNGQSDKVHFKDVLISLTTQAIKNTMGGELDHLKRSIKVVDDITYKKTVASGAQVVTSFSSRGDEGSSVFKLREFYAAVLVQHTLRHNRMIRMAKKARAEYMNKFVNDGENGAPPAGTENLSKTWGHRASVNKISLDGIELTDVSTTPSKRSPPPRAAAGGGSPSGKTEQRVPFSTKTGTNTNTSEGCEDDDGDEEEDKDNMVHEKKTIKGIWGKLTKTSNAGKRIKGKKVFLNGDVYEGDMVDGIMDGHGTYNYHEGAKYTGQLKRGMREGYGEYTSISGERYIGYFHKNKRHGEGSKFHLDGNVQVGQWSYGHFLGEDN
jgi:hypothetical protein